jgi:hypothetical protein
MLRLAPLAWLPRKAEWHDRVRQRRNRQFAVSAGPQAGGHSHGRSETADIGVWHSVTGWGHGLVSGGLLLLAARSTAPDCGN